MTYSPHTWQPGEIISSARLNALEQGVAAGGGGEGYDAEISCYLPASSSADWEFDIVSGSYASITALMADDTAPRILMRIVCEYAPSYWTVTDNVAVHYWQTEVSVPVFEMCAIIWVPGDGINTMVLAWNANDEIFQP